MNRFAMAACAAAWSTLAWTPSARAQRPPGADTLSATAIAESLAVRAHLRAQLLKHPKDAASWYRLGMLVWALYDRDHSSHSPFLDWTLLGREADTSLRLARSLDPKNARYVLTAGQYFLGTGLITMRGQSYAMFSSALDMSRANGDSAVHAESALEVGRVYWRSYDAVANAGYETSDATEVRMLAEALSKDTAEKSKAIDPGVPNKRRPYTRQSVSRARTTLDRTWVPPEAGFAGEADYIQADIYLREAYETMPSYPRAYQQLSMLLAEKARWTELKALARDHIGVTPADAWTWMTLGLATYRLGDTKAARAAFDSGLRFMSNYDRRRLDHVERVLRPSDSALVGSPGTQGRTDFERRFWASVDPLWSRDDIDARVEFLARLSFAELRWTVEEISKRGADSDRGNIYIRYGPPDRIATLNGGSTWSYDYAGLNFRFKGAPTYGTSFFTDYGVALVKMDSIPALWDNMSSVFIDSLPVQAARFRAPGDAFDVLFAARPPVERIRRASDVKAPIRSDFWMTETGNATVVRDSLLGADAEVRTFTKRVPFGTYTYRFEATADGSLVAGRSTGTVSTDSLATSPFYPHGFAISDLLLATRAAPRAGAPQRWSDLDIAPLAGTISRDAELSLVWENYEFGERESQSKYQVTVTIAAERPLPGRITAKILGALAGIAGRNDYVDGVRFRFERAVPYAEIVSDLVTISLDKTPPGSYLVTLAVTDQISGRSTERTRRVVVN